MEVLSDLWDPLSQVLGEEILEFAGEFDTGWSTANDDHVQETLDFVCGLVFESSGLAAVHDALADHLGVADFLEEETVFADTWDTFASR